MDLGCYTNQKTGKLLKLAYVLIDFLKNSIMLSASICYSTKENYLSCLANVYRKNLFNNYAEAFAGLSYIFIIVCWLQFFTGAPIF